MLPQNRAGLPRMLVWQHLLPRGSKRSWYCLALIYLGFIITAWLINLLCLPHSFTGTEPTAVEPSWRTSAIYPNDNKTNSKQHALSFICTEYSGFRTSFRTNTHVIHRIKTVDSEALRLSINTINGLPYSVSTSANAFVLLHCFKVVLNCVIPECPVFSKVTGVCISHCDRNVPAQEQHQYLKLKRCIF